MAKLTLVETFKAGDAPSADPVETPADPAQTLTVVKDFLNIPDPAVQNAVADLIAALARLPV